MNILYTLNDKFIPQVAASICSVCENNKHLDKINFFIISNGITDINKAKLTEFIKGYNRKITIKELGDINQYFDFEFDTTGWNSIVIVRLILDKFLPDDIEKILYLDGDTIVRGSLKELWNTNIEKDVLAASIEPTVDKKRKNELGLQKYPYYNSGVLLINLKKWREQGISSKIVEFYRLNNERMFAPDQDAINCYLKEQICTISPKYNFYNIFYNYTYSFLCKLMKPVEYISKELYQDAVKEPIIIHYLGEERPWRKGNQHRYRDDYIKYLLITPWKETKGEEGWKLYFFCFYIFNFFTKPFPSIRYKIINFLIPLFMKIRANKLKK